MKKRPLLLLCVAILSLFALASCAFPPPGGEAPPAEEEKDEQGLLYTLLEDDTYAVSVGDAAGCREIVIPASFKDKPVSEISASGFVGSWALKKLTVLGNELTTVGASAFRGCARLAEISLPNSVVVIGEYAFYNCEALTDAVLGTGIGAIGDYAFYSCKTLAEVMLPEGLLRIGKGAFYKCEALINVAVPASVESIGASAFEGCSTMESIQLPFVGNNKNANNDVHFGDIFGTLKAESVPNSLKNVVLTSGTQIPPEAFKDCAGLRTISLPATLRAVGADAFEGCDAIESVYVSDLAAFCAIRFGSAAANPASLAGGLIIGEEALSGELRIPDSVESVGDYCFAGFTKITSLVVSEGVGSIGVSAFENCTGLTSVFVADNVERIGFSAFAGCESLSLLSVPFTGDKKDGTGVTHLGYIFGSESREGSRQRVPSALKTVVLTASTVAYSAFYECESVEEIRFTASITSIGNHAFAACSALSRIVLPESVQSIGAFAFLHCSALSEIVIPNGVTSVGERCFYGCSSLTSAWIGGELLEIAAETFADCVLLSRLVFAEQAKLSVIGTNAFYGCTSLGEIHLPASVTEIGELAFHGCTGITSVVLPEGLEIIQNGAFDECKNLAFVTFGSSIKVFGENVFRNCKISYTVEGGANYVGPAENPYLVLVRLNVRSSSCAVNARTKTIANGAFRDCMRLRSVTLPGGITAISRHAFAKCSALTSIVIPEGVKTVGYGAFEACSSLSSVSMPSTLEEIGQFAFDTCRSLLSIHIPDSVTLIEDCAFFKCEALAEIVLGAGVTSIGNTAFSAESIERVFYKGSAAAFDSIAIGEHNNEPLCNATRYYYSETAPEQADRYWHYGASGEICIWGNPA